MSLAGQGGRRREVAETCRSRLPRYSHSAGQIPGACPILGRHPGLGPGANAPVHAVCRQQGSLAFAPSTAVHSAATAYRVEVGNGSRTKSGMTSERVATLGQRRRCPLPDRDAGVARLRKPAALDCRARFAHPHSAGQIPGACPILGRHPGLGPGANAPVHAVCRRQGSLAFAPSTAVHSAATTYRVEVGNGSRTKPRVTPERVATFFEAARLRKADGPPALLRRPRGGQRALASARP